MVKESMAASGAVLSTTVHADCWDGPHFRLFQCGINDFRRTPSPHAMFLDAMEVMGCWEYVLSGSICYKLESERYRIGAGEALITRRPDPGWMLRPVKGEPTQTLWLSVKGEQAMRMFDYLHLKYGQIQTFSPDSRVVRQARRIVRLALEEPQRPGHFWSAATFHWLNAWWQCAELQHRAPGQQLNAVKPSRLISIGPKTVKGFAAEVGYSRAYLTRTLTKQWHRSPGRVMREVRLQQAATLLRTTHLSVGEVATKVGYCTAGAFSRAFAQHFQQSPRQYKLMHH